MNTQLQNIKQNIKQNEKIKNQKKIQKIKNQKKIYLSNALKGHSCVPSLQNLSAYALHNYGDESLEDEGFEYLERLNKQDSFDLMYVKKIPYIDFIVSPLISDMLTPKMNVDRLRFPFFAMIDGYTWPTSYLYTSSIGDHLVVDWRKYEFSCYWYEKFNELMNYITSCRTSYWWEMAHHRDEIYFEEGGPFRRLIRTCERTAQNFILLEHFDAWMVSEYTLKNPIRFYIPVSFAWYNLLREMEFQLSKTADFPTYLHDFNNLIQCGDVELNPGPVFSKPTFSRECTIKVGTEGISDWFNIPKVFSSFSIDFSKFVEKMPDKDQMINCAHEIFTRMEGITSKIVSTTEKTVAFGEKAMEGLKSIIVKCVAVLVFAVFRIYGGSNSLLATIGKFLVDYLGLSVIFASLKKITGFETKVPTEGIVDDIFGDNTQVMPLVGAGIFSLLFIHIFKQQPKNNEVKDIFQSAFIYNRGIDSLAGLFDKAFSVWEMVQNKLLYHRLGKDIPLTKYDASCKIDSFLKDLQKIFTQDFDALSFDEKKQYRKDVADLHKRSVDILIAVDKIPKQNQAGIRQMITLLNQKYTQVISQPLTGKMRLGMFPVVLAGGSGVGKTRLMPILQAVAAKVLEKELGVAISQDNVVALNMDADHADGYLGQHIVFCNDVFKRKNSEANPNNELDFFMCAIDQAPYPLKMANLAEKGMFFTSLCGIVTTNVLDIANYAKESQSYVEAVCTRLNYTFKVQVKPCYRKYISQSLKTQLLREQKTFQHSVDPNRAKYIVNEESFERLGIRRIEHDNLLETYTDEEFDKMEKKLLKDANTLTPINTNVYVFQRYSLLPYQTVGPKITYEEFLQDFTTTFTKHLRTGGVNLEEQTKFYNLSLEDMLKGTPSFVETEGIRERFNNWWYKNQNQEEEDIEEFVDCAPAHEQDVYEHEMLTFLAEFGYIENFEELVDSGETGRFHDALEQAVERFGPAFVADARMRSYRMRRERAEFFEREAFRHLEFSQKFEFLKQKFLNSSTFQVLCNVGVVLGAVASIYGITKAFRYLIDKAVDVKNPNASIVRDFVEEKRKNSTWLEWFKSFIGPNRVKLTDVNNVPLNYDDLSILFDIYGILVDPESASPGGKSQQRQRLLRLRVPTQVAQVLTENIKDAHLMRDNKDCVEFPEEKINAVMVFTQSLMSQLTEVTLDHVIPASQWFLTIKDKGVGNVLFLDGENVLMPFHYVKMIESMKNGAKVTDDDPVIFERGCTLQELIHNNGQNEVKTIVTQVRYLKNYRQIKSGLPKDNSQVFEKDAVIVNIPAKFKSGTTCRNIKKKFMKRKDMARLSAIQCTGNIFNWRKKEGILVQNVTSLTDITPVNLVTSSQSCPLIEYQPHIDDKGQSGTLELVLRTRYEYTINSTYGDCGSVLWINDNQVPQGMCGIHVSKAAIPGKSCSVPITYEDIEETMANFVKTEVIPIETIELTKEEMYAPDRIAPDAPFEVIGKIADKDFKTFQPTKSSWVNSPLGERLDDLKWQYRQLGKNYQMEQKMSQTRLKPFVVNSETSIYHVRDGRIRNCDGTTLSEAQWDEFRSSGAEFVSPVLKSLRKAKRHIPYFDPATLARINAYLTQVLSKGWKNGYFDLDAYISSITNTGGSVDVEAKQYHDETIVRMYRFKENFFSKLFFTDHKVTQRRMMENECQEVVDFNPKYKYLALHLLKEMRGRTEEQFYVIWPHLFSILFTEAFLIPSNVKKTFDVRTAVKGIDGNRACKSMNAKSSPGYGGFWNGKPYVNRGWPMGKKCWFGEDFECNLTKEDIKIDGKIVCTAEQVKKNFKGLEEDVEYILKVAEKKEPDVVFVATLKDEKRSFEKCVSGDTRAFYQCDMATCIASKCVIGPVWSWYIQNNIENGLAVAINPYGMDWERIAEKMLQFGEGGVIAGDYKAFDLSQGQQVQEIAVDIDCNVAKNGGITSAEQLRQIANMGGALTRKYVLVNGEVLTRVEQIVGSGSPDTVLRDCKCNIINILYIFSEIFDRQTAKKDLLGIVDGFVPFELDDFEENSPEYLLHKHLNIVNNVEIPKISLMDVHEYLVWEMCGDDHLLAVAPSIRPWFNQRTLSAMMTEIGMTYTDEKKTGNTPPELRKLEDVTFLKRSFKRVNGHGRRWIGPLDIDVVKEISLWRTNNQSIECPEALMTNMKTALREMALHGELEYNNMKEFFEFSWNKIYPMNLITFEDWETSYVAVLNSDSDLDF